MDDDETWSAYHEAGHAVVAYALGGTVDSIRLGGEADDWLPERFGDCRISWGRVDPNCPWQVQREVLTILAGPVAEMVYRGETLDPARYGPWQHDWQLAWSACATTTDSDRSAAKLIQHLMRQLHQHVRSDRLWAAIAALADELVVHEMLETEEIGEILRFWLG